jgi:uncharacterized repeat protein (TIGR03803 family)
MSLIRLRRLNVSGHAVAVVTAVYAALLSSLAFAGLTGTFALQHTFDDMDGAFPFGSLVQGSDGNFYGTSIGEDYNVGTAFKLSPKGVFTVLHTFGGVDGGFPEAALVEGTDGNFYGTTKYGGAANDGTVFVMTPAGVLTTLHSFGYSDGWEPNGLARARDGSFYGTSDHGGANNAGVVFRITPAGAFTLLHSFSGPDGANPQSALTLGRDDYFYGVTYYGGANNNSGTLFRMTPAGRLTTLYSFDNTHGSNPTAALAEDSAGNFYGTTEFVGGLGGEGAVFKYSAAGTVTVVYKFIDGGPGGVFPDGGVIVAPNGALYGTCLAGGPKGAGTVFALTPAGELSVLHAFGDGSDGGSPATGVVRSVSGKLYGTTTDGGTNFDGTLYSVAVSVAAAE